MISVVLGVLGSAIYGASDFLGGLAARRISAVTTTAFVSLVGLIVLLIALPFIPSVWDGGGVFWGFFGGFAGAICVGLFYACLAIGPISVLTPIMSLTSAVVPIVLGFAFGNRIGIAGVVGIAIGLVAILLICLSPREGSARATTRGIVMAASSGLFVGLYLVIIDQTSDASGLAPLVVVFLTSTVVMFAAVGVLALVHRRRKTPVPIPAYAVVTVPVVVPGGPVEAAVVDGQSPSSNRLAGVGRRSTLATTLIAAGVLDALASAFFLLALRNGELVIVSILSALSPAGTIILAAIFLKERVARVQLAGLILAGVAAVLLALP